MNKKRHLSSRMDAKNLTVEGHKMFLYIIYKLSTSGWTQVAISKLETLVWLRMSIIVATSDKEE